MRRFRVPSTAGSGGVRTRRSGAVLVLVAIVLAVLLGLVGLAIDTAYVRKTNQELQVAADAAALAGAQKILEDAGGPLFTITRQAAIDTAAANLAAGKGVQLESNDANTTTGDIVVGSWDPVTQTFTPQTSRVNAVQVRAERTDDSLGGPIGLFFGSLFGAETSDVARSAIATLGPGPLPAVIILDPTADKAYDQRGNSRFEVPYNGITVDSNHPCAFSLNGQPGVPRVRAGFVNVVGDACTPLGTVKPSPVPGSPYEPDPLADVPEPTTVGLTVRADMRTAATYNEGHYPGGCDLSGGVTTLSPGIYYLGPPGLNLTGDAVVEGDGVMLFLAEGAEIRITGSGAGLDISPPTSGPYEGISVFYDRDNATTCSISGGGVFDVDGTMYMKSAHLEMDGNVDRQVGRIIVNTFQLRGNGRYTITGRFLTDEPLIPILVD